jgi:hypothetical protein
VVVVGSHKEESGGKRVSQRGSGGNSFLGGPRETRALNVPDANNDLERELELCVPACLSLAPEHDSCNPGSHKEESGGKRVSQRGSGGNSFLGGPRETRADCMHAESLFEKASLPFHRPTDYFAEMVKTDAHMAQISSVHTKKSPEAKGSAKGEAAAIPFLEDHAKRARGFFDTLTLTNPKPLNVPDANNDLERELELCVPARPS